MREENLLLGKKVSYSTKYDPSLLTAISRGLQRCKLNLDVSLPFKGIDVWNCYEFSYLNSQGKPMVLILELYIDAMSANIVESKSVKLYLSSFQNSKFETLEEVISRVKKDFCLSLEGEVEIIPRYLEDSLEIKKPDAKSIDQLNLVCTEYEVNPNLLKVSEEEVIKERVYSNLLKSNCLVTGQPDWATVIIEYTGNKISEDSLLRYIVSYRNHSEFHEHCIERIFCDIMKKCQPQYLTVYGRYTRRGGIDINPYRSNCNFFKPDNFRLMRQ